MTSSAVSQRFQFLAVDALARHGSSSSLPTMHTYLYTKYDEKMDFLGKNLIGLIAAPKAKVKAMIPVLRDASEMEQRLGSAQELQDYHGDIADEVHEFLNATQGTSKLLRIRLKGGRVIDMSIKS